MTEAEKERIKLRANYLNGVANAFVVAGALTVPLAAATEALPIAIAAPFSGQSLEIGWDSGTALVVIDGRPRIDEVTHVRQVASRSFFGA